MKLVHSIPAHDAFPLPCAMAAMFKALFPSGLGTALLRMVQDCGNAPPAASGEGVRGAGGAGASAVGGGTEVERDSGVAEATGITGCAGTGCDGMRCRAGATRSPCTEDVADSFGNLPKPDNVNGLGWKSNDRSDAGPSLLVCGNVNGRTLKSSVTGRSRPGTATPSEGCAPARACAVAGFAMGPARQSGILSASAACPRHAHLW